MVKQPKALLFLPIDCQSYGTSLMQAYRIKLLTWTVFWSMSVISLMAAPSALIVIGTTGNETTTNDLSNVADEIKTSLAQRGFAANDVEILRSTSLGDRVTSERILQALKHRESLTSSDEFWLVLLGFAGRDDLAASRRFKSAARASRPSN